MELRTPSHFALVALIDGSRHGYGIIRRVDELSGGTVRLFGRSRERPAPGAAADDALNASRLSTRGSPG
jgi:hypothetical protein